MLNLALSSDVEVQNKQDTFSIISWAWSAWWMSLASEGKQARGCSPTFWHDERCCPKSFSLFQLYCTDLKIRSLRCQIRRQAPIRKISNKACLILLVRPKIQRQWSTAESFLHIFATRHKPSWHRLYVIRERNLPWLVIASRLVSRHGMACFQNSRLVS